MFLVPISIIVILLIMTFIKLSLILGSSFLFPIDILPVGIAGGVVFLKMLAIICISIFWNRKGE